jgi:putative ABC transport system permease protein
MSFADDVVRDAKYAARLYLRSPGFTVVALATLAIAIGATVTVFSIVDAWLVRPLNFPEAGRLVIAFGARPERPREPAVWLPYREYLAWKERSRSLVSVSAVFMHDATVATSQDAETALGLKVTPEFFTTLGVGPLRGRTISDEDITGPPAVVISYGFWQRHFGGADRAIGAAVVMSGVPHQILGVMPRDFESRVLDLRFDFWTPFRRGETGYQPGGLGPVTLIGRLREGITIDTAQSEAAAITRDTESRFQSNFNGFVTNLATLQADNTRTVRATLLTVSVAVLGLLLIAGVNIGSMLLGRGLGRQRETAIRSAIGSSRSRLIRQFLTESVLVTAAGGSAGVLLAAVAVRAFVAWNPLGTLPAHAIHLDLRALIAAGGAMAATVVVSGLVPAFRLSHADPSDVLRSAGRGSSWAPAQRTQLTMLVAQMSACVVLLVATTLMTRTFMRLQSEPLGFDARQLSVANVILPDDPFDSSGKRNTFYRELADRVRALPGVRAVAAGTMRPLISGPPVTLNVTEANAVDAPRISAQSVTPEFFETLGIPMIAGRAFDGRDGAVSTPVVILNARAAQNLFGGPASAIGRRVRLGNDSWREVIGVAGNVRAAFFNTLEWKTDPIVYRPAAQAFDTTGDPAATSFGFHLHIRSEQPVTLADVRSVAASVSPQAMITDLQTADRLVGNATRQPTFRMALLLGFGLVSLLLSAIGTYGLVSQAVTQRLRDIAIRLALGAEPAGLIRIIVRRALVAAAAGVFIGLAAAALVGSAMQAMIYGIRPRDSVSFAAAGITLLIVTAAGALVPALRAIHIDPIEILRAD